MSGRTSDYLEKYKTSILSEDERSKYMAVVGARAEYFVVRTRVLSLAEAGQVEEALAQFKEALIPTQPASNRPAMGCWNSTGIRPNSAASGL